jgi:L-ribulose-5-phosphate 3-epimerase UlaE
MNDIEKIDYVIETIIKTLKAMEDDIGNLPQWELENSLELLKDLREPLFLELKKDMEGWDSMAKTI